MKFQHVFCAISWVALVGCEQDLAAPSNPDGRVSLAARFQAGTTVPAVDSIEAKLVRPGLDSEVQTTSYTRAKGTYLKFRSIALNDSFQLTLTGFDHTGDARVVRWWTTRGGTARQSPLQTVALGIIDSVTIPRDSIFPTSHYVGATFALTGTWRYTTNGEDPRTSPSAQDASGSLTVNAAGTVCIAHSTKSADGPVIWSDTSCWTFAGLDPDSFMTDRAGKVYPIVQLGTQKWMAANLDWVPEGSDSSWCFADSPSNCELYGRLYAWSQASVACPSGWHLPSKSEWVTLVGRVGILTADLKASTSWPAGSAGTNSTGFAILPGNSRFNGGYAGYSVGGNVDANFWSSTAVPNTTNAYVIEVPKPNASTIAVSTSGKQNGYSVRCLAD